MQNTNLESIETILQQKTRIPDFSDEKIVINTEQLIHHETEVLSVILLYFKEIEARKIYSSLGYSSLFDFAVKKFGYSEHQAYRRIDAMKLLKELPQLDEKIASGSLNLANIGWAQNLFRKEAKLGNSFSGQKKIAVLKQLENKSARESEKIVMALSSNPEIIRHEKVRAVSTSRSEYRFTAHDGFREKLDKLRGLLAHSNPNASMAEILEKACDIAIAKLDLGSKKNEEKTARRKRKLNGATNDKCKAATSIKHRTINNDSKSEERQSAMLSQSRSNKRQHIPAEIKRFIWRNAQSRCEICQSKFALEIDHIKPKSKNGSDAPENLRLLCRSCNQRAAIDQLGKRFMQGYV